MALTGSPLNTLLPHGHRMTRRIRIPIATIQQGFMDLSTRPKGASAKLVSGPLNRDQQKQIQAVLANAATVKDGWSLVPWWIHIRCDDVSNLCPSNCDPEATGADDGEEVPNEHGTVYAYARDTYMNHEKYPDINFCLPFFARRDLDTTVAQASAPSNPKLRFNLNEYDLSQGQIMLHELLHLDVAADSVNESPNPRVHDLEVRFKYFKENDPPEPGHPGRYVLSRWYKAYGPKLAKFSPVSFQDRGIIGGYPWLPFVTENPYDQPLSPTAEDLAEPYINFNREEDDGMTVFNWFNITINGSLPIEGNEECPYSAHGTTLEGDLEIGPPAADDLYPDTYWRERKEFEKFVIDNEDLKAICKLAVREVWTCEDIANNLYASLQFTSAGGVVLYETRGHQPGVPINDGNPFHLQEAGMNHELKVVGQHTNDYMHFWYGDINWTSGTAEGEAFCKLDGDDWDKNGPQGCPNAPAIARDFDCEFPC
ncbi:hypothetical protein DL771_009146 [Monosporascus sp. 5C6A]|nr:hypothetical protein DL771_009146 [Monosporascus sp. 5C6A]